jgi:hypothetical protein
MSKELSDFLDTQSPARQQAILQQIDKLGGIEKANELATKVFSKDKITALSTQGTEFVHELQGQVAATRRGAIQDDLREKLQYAAEQAGVQVEVVSGGQRMPGAPGAVGSTRHDHGGAADLKLFRIDKDGKKEFLDMRKPEDREIMKKFAKESVKAGATGIGAGMSYMGPHTMHIGGGRETHWGGADFIGEAHSEGIVERKSGDYEKWKEIKREKKRAEDAAKTGSPKNIPLRPGDPIPGPREEPTPVPMEQRGITFGHPNETVPEQPTPTPTPAPAAPQSTNPRAPGYSPPQTQEQPSVKTPTPVPAAPTVTPAPAPRPPATSGPGEVPKGASPEQKMDEIEVPQKQSAAPQPKPPVQAAQVGQAEINTKVEAHSPSAQRAYAQANFEPKHYQGGAASVSKTA